MEILRAVPLEENRASASPDIPKHKRRSGRSWRMKNVGHSLALTLAARLMGNRLSALLSEMQRAQWLTAEELSARSEARLVSLLKHATANTPFYRELPYKLAVRSADFDVRDYLRALPVVSKAFYRERGPEEFLAENIPAYRRIPKSTSGSTGEPFQFYLDREAMPVIFSSHLFYDSWFGLSPFERYVRIMSPPAVIPALMKDAPVRYRLRQALNGKLQQLYESWTQRRISIWEMNGERAVDVWRCLEHMRPGYIMGYTSTLANIADELLKRNLQLSRQLRAVVTIAETLTPSRRRLIEQCFNALIVNRYGLRELGSWSAQSCSESPEQFHINTELVICEILREDGSEAAHGELGRVVLTDLWNYARPFIRYETGDLAFSIAGECKCGRGFPLLGQIEGRSLEYLKTPSGKHISPVVLGHFLFVYNDHLEAVKHYQLIQEGPNHARLLVVPSSLWDESRREKIRNDLSRLLGDELIVTVDSVNEIPLEKSGKRPIIKSYHDSSARLTTLP